MSPKSCLPFVICWKFQLVQLLVNFDDLPVPHHEDLVVVTLLHPKLLDEVVSQMIMACMENQKKRPWLKWLQDGVRSNWIASIAFYRGDCYYWSFVSERVEKGCGTSTFAIMCMLLDWWNCAKRFHCIVNICTTQVVPIGVDYIILYSRNSFCKVHHTCFGFAILLSTPQQSNYQIQLPICKQGTRLREVDVENTPCSKQAGIDLSACK